MRVTLNTVLRISLISVILQLITFLKNCKRDHLGRNDVINGVMASHCCQILAVKEFIR